MALAAAPAAPKLLSPEAGATGGSVTPTFRWSNVGAAWYHLYLAPGMGGGTITHSNLTKTSYSFASEEALSYDTSYAWSVRACNSGELVVECTDSEGRWYTTKKASASVAPEPEDGSESSCGECLPGQICNPLAYCNIEDLVNAIIRFLIMIGSPIAGVMFVVAGVMFVTSAGDPERVRTARRVMIYTAVGLAVILVASGLIKVLQSLLGGS